MYKSEDKHLFTNYRPISLTSTFVKIVEKIVVKQMMAYMKKHRMIYDHQYGFPPGHNTTQPMIHFLEKFYSAFNHTSPKLVAAVFIDLKKAFDTVDHDILLKKLEFYGFRGAVNTWFRNFLGGREQYVFYRGKNSKKRTISCGVPQGTCLGPILFLIFINDLANATDLFTILFADDTTFLYEFNDLITSAVIINRELTRAAEWFQANKLTLNTKKTKFMLFSRKKIPNSSFPLFTLKIGNETIERIGSQSSVKSFKFVGHHIDDQLSWDFHIKYVTQKISKGCFALATTKKIIPLKIRQTIYNCLVRPYLEFGLVIWGGAKKKLIDSVIKKQKIVFAILPYAVPCRVTYYISKIFSI